SRSQPFEFEKDEPPVLLGEDHGANPVEYALAALNDCLTTSLIYHAAAKGIKIDEVESTLAGDLDLHGFLGLNENVRNGYEKIQVTFKIKADAPEEKLGELVEIAQKRSPVFDIISHPTPVEVSMEKKQ
ncbi:MAG: OsmC family protein, partial [Thermoproteota archaeon]|nr:OsmC family protein [Thermoproteota archaeon]